MVSTGDLMVERLWLTLFSHSVMLNEGYALTCISQKLVLFFVVFFFFQISASSCSRPFVISITYNYSLPFGKKCWTFSSVFLYCRYTMIMCLKSVYYIYRNLFQFILSLIKLLTSPPSHNHHICGGVTG